MWVRGLKHPLGHLYHNKSTVAPYVGAWIETATNHDMLLQVNVAPYVGAWIETVGAPIASLSIDVAPYVGAWIETSDFTSSLNGITSRTLCGCVD